MSEQKTEQPTPRRLQKARERGQFATSREFLAGVQFFFFVALLSLYGESWFGGAQSMMRALLAGAFRPALGAADLLSLSRSLLLSQIQSAAAFGGMLIAGALAIQMASTRFGIATSRLKPDWQRLNVLSRMKQLRRQNIPAFTQALFLLPLFLYAALAITGERFEEYLRLSSSTIRQSAGMLGQTLGDLLWRAAALFLIFGCIDLYRQRRKHLEDLRMTKQEIRTEHKETEGNPQIKAQIRRLRRERMRRGMLQAVPTATAVVVNPTHYAVAIRYEPGDMAAPSVVAKGKNLIARRIREIAEQHRVPIVENVPLAQALYKSTEAGQEIPAHLYRAVAEILAYVYKLMNGRFQGRQ